MSFDSARSSQSIPVTTPSAHGLNSAGAFGGYPTFLSRTRQRVPHLELVPPTGCHTPCLPPITFDYRNSRGQGVYASELVAGAGFVALHGGEDCILAKLDSSVIMEELCVYILWPGYTPYELTYKIQAIHCCGRKSPLTGTVSSRETRAGLAQRIAVDVKHFFERSTSFGEELPWRIGANYIAFESCVLLGVRHVYGSVWQVELAVDSPLQY